MIDYTLLAFVTTLIIVISEHLRHFKIMVKYLPWLNLMLGIIAGFIFISPHNMKYALLSGLSAGLSANLMIVGKNKLKSKKNK